MILGEELVTTGAENDIQRATQLAKKMVIKWGLSVLGPLDYSSTSQSPFGESESKEPYEYSQQTLQKIDAEVKKILDASYKKAYALLKENKDKLITMAQALMTYETINEKQIEAIMNGEDYSKVDSDVWDKPKNDKKTEDEE
jgi:cell division protease FtsH